MTSANMFSDTRNMLAAATSDSTLHYANNSTLRNTDSTVSKLKVEKLSVTPSYQDLHMVRSSTSLYDQVLVCLFCSQFFQSQEDYRPSYAEVLHKERKANYSALVEQERQYWDPLMMMDKDKKEEEEEKERSEYDALHAMSSLSKMDDFVDANNGHDGPTEQP